MSDFKASIFKKIDDELFERIRPKAIKGLTPDQAAKMNAVSARKFNRDQIQSIRAECLAWMPKSVFKIFEDDLSAKQIAGVEGLESV